MPYEEERLEVLEAVSRGRLSPGEARLRIAMLKEKYRAAPAAPPGEPAAPRTPRRTPLAAFIVVYGLLLLALALPVGLAVAVWNATFAALGLPGLPFGVTLVAAAALAASALALAWHRLRRRLEDDAP